MYYWLHFVSILKNRRCLTVFIIPSFNIKPSDIHINDSEIDDSTELPIVNANDAIKSLELVRSFLQQQEDSKELLKHLIITLA